MEKDLFHAFDEEDFDYTINLSDLESKIVSSPFFHRLHDIYESSTAYMPFPSNHIIRYEHAFGVMDLSKNMLSDFTSYVNVKSNVKNTDVEKTIVKIVDEIFDINKPKDISKKENAIIALSPVNDAVLKYLSENPQAFYQLADRDFEIVMAEIYNRLGYKVELTKATRDGGKDIIIRKPDILGDFVYYVECKKYAANKPVGVGIVRNLAGIINIDRVNGGIIATTSYFAKDAKDLILNQNLNFQIKLHDYEKIRNLLNKVV